METLPAPPWWLAENPACSRHGNRSLRDFRRTPPEGFPHSRRSQKVRNECAIRHPARASGQLANARLRTAPLAPPICAALRDPTQPNEDDPWEARARNLESYRLACG